VDQFQLDPFRKDNDYYTNQDTTSRFIRKKKRVNIGEK